MTTKMTEHNYNCEMPRTEIESGCDGRAFGIDLIRATKNFGIVPETFKAWQTE